MRKTFKIAIVTNSGWNIYNFRRPLISALMSLGHDVYVLAPPGKYSAMIKNIPGLKYIPLARLKRAGVNPIADLVFLFELTKKYQFIRPEMIIHFTHKPNIYGGVAAKLLGIKSYAVITGLGYAFLNHSGLKSLIRFLYRTTLSFHQNSIFENIEDLQYFKAHNLLPASKGLVVPGCGVNTEYFKPDNSISAGEAVSFTFVGRLLKDKGLQEFLLAAEFIKTKYPQVTFVVVGDYDPQNPGNVDKLYFEHYVQKQVITWAGWVEDVRDHIRASTCIVLPSYREAMARSITEAMSMEKPVITTDTPGCRELIVDQLGGYVVPVKNWAALAEAMEKILTLSCEERQRMGRYNRQKIIHGYSDEQVVDGYLTHLGLK